VLLKRLTLVGFKSFADRTRLEVDAGVNIVVGPNGSGKSNLLDAVAWVMGTQATKSLRTEKMEDVVFAGTASRPAVSGAEVSLTFDNNDGFLPVDISDITITRRLHRDGTSEYELNGTSCRLLDIQELLSDGGVGRHQHVLVSQGEIGLVLTASPEEHRAVIEEAAGITKHRSRRDRAVRRLEATDLDVERLNDILTEKRRALRPLKRQANAAARHGEVKAEAKALRLWLGGEELRDLERREQSASVEESERSTRLEAQTGEREAAIEQLRELRASAGEAGASLERDTAAAARLETVTERLRRYGVVARERRAAIEGRLEGAEERRGDLEVELAELVEEMDAVGVRLGRATAEAEQHGVALHALEDEERALAEQMQLPAEGVVANLRGDLRSLEAAASRDDRERQSIGSRRRVVVARLEEETAEAVELNGWIQKADGLGTGAQRAYEDARSARESAQQEFERFDRELADVQLAVAAGEARIEALQTSMSGLGDPEARSIVDGTDGVIGAVAGMLDAPQDLAPAVDAALGIWSDAYVVDGVDMVRNLARALKQRGLGGVSAIASRPGGEVPARPAARAFGADALVDLLGERADRVLAEQLLGDVVLVAGWEMGWQVVQRFDGLRAVTPEGDVITAMGMRVAQADGVGFAALEAANVAHEVAETERARIEGQRTSSRAALDAAMATERAALEALEEIEAQIAGHTEALALIARARSEGEAEISRLDDRLAAITAGETARSTRVAELKGRLAEFEGEEAVRQEAWEALSERREEVGKHRVEAARLREEAAATVARSAERRDLLERRIEQIRAEVAELAHLPADDPRINALEDIETRADHLVGLVRSHIDVLRARQRRIREQVGDVDVALRTAEERREALDAGVTEDKDRLAVLAVELAELRVRREAAGERIRRDADATEEEALGAPRPELDEGVEPTERLEALDADLRRMGLINPLAAAEYEELAAGVALLDEQLEDLNESRRELIKVIDVLDEEMTGLFIGAFEEISALYEQNFGLVFPGGRGRLRLLEPDDPLRSGVEVEAQPHGKKVGRLSLLSGGERSLAALAFLFAVFRARPSPFYVLDEVEAALDDSNLHRFLRLVDQLRDSAQLVIITHQQQTMQAADMLYGITMEPGESSKVLAKRMSAAST
jgi:chromosome segregation protein